MLWGQAVFADHGAHGVVKVFNASGHVVARRDAHYPRAHFRFVLQRGRYKVQLKMKKRWVWGGCRYTKAVHVRAHRTSHVTLSQGCSDY